MIVLFSFLSVFVLLKYKLILTTGFLILTVIFIGINLYFYIQNKIKKIDTFFSAINCDDYNNIYLPRHLGASFDSLRNNMQEVLNNMKKIRQEKEIQFNYLKNVIQHIGIAILVFNNKNKIEFYNHALKKLFQVSNLTSINNLEKISPKLANKIISLKNHQRSLIKFSYNEIYYQLIIYSTKFIVDNKKITIVSLQNIHSELEQQEFLSWQKLIRVLRHEIMNSITPIASLSSSLNLALQNFQNKTKKIIIDDSIKNELKDIKTSVQTIEKRSKGLIHFVDKYRNLSKIDMPDFNKIEVVKLFNNLRNLFQKEFDNNKIQFKIEIFPSNLTILADYNLLEQVFVNLIKNSINALKNSHNKKIQLKAVGIENSTVLKLCDNGCGIKKDVLTKVFVPFFTTKHNGSGIGLSICKQIMLLHKGRITVRSQPSEGTEFRLILRKY